MNNILKQTNSKKINIIKPQKSRNPGQNSTSLINNALLKPHKPLNLLIFKRKT